MAVDNQSENSEEFEIENDFYAMETSLHFSDQSERSNLGLTKQNPRISLFRL